MQRNKYYVPVLLFTLALSLRLIAIHIWRNADYSHGDPSEYLALAHNLRYHGTFSFGEPHPWGADGSLNPPGPFLPTASRAPLYPIVIAMLWWKTVPPILWVRILQGILGAFTVLLTYRIALQVLPRLAVLVGIAMALAPLTLRMTADVMSETLFAFLLTLGIYLWGLRRAWSAGAVLGLATLTRPVLLPFFILLLALGVLQRDQRKVYIKIAVGGMLVVIPWTVRNVIALHHLVLVNSQGWGSNLIFGTLDVAYGNGNPWFYYTDTDIKRIISTTATESEGESQMIDESLRRIERHPLYWIWVRAKEYPRLFGDTATYLYEFGPPRLIKIIFLLGSVVFLLLSVIGLWLAPPHITLFPIYFIVVQFPMLGDVRYSLPLTPLMVILSFVTLSRSDALRRVRCFRLLPPASPGKAT